MTRLTETLCKSRGARNANKNVKKFINYTVTTYQNNKIRQPNTLGNRVSEQTSRQQEAECRDEMLVMMACWKRNEFRPNSCTEEYNNFAKCVSQHKARRLKDQSFADTAELGKVSEDGKMNPKQVNKLLRMYPQPPYKITITHGAGIPQPKPLVFNQYKEDNSQRGAPRTLWGKPTKQNK